MSVPVLGPADAVEVARTLGRALADGDIDRDLHRSLPYDEVKGLAESGLLALTVPAAFGGADASVSTVTEVFRALAWGDPNVAQIPHSHVVFLNQLRLHGSPEHQQRIFGEVLAGSIVANAQSEFGSKHVRDIRTTLSPAGAGWLLNGEKFYATGSLFADYLAVLSRRETDGSLQVAWIRKDASGVEVVDDWDAVGQRTTGSGTVRLTDVVVGADWVTPFSVEFDRPTTYGAFAQVLHAAIDVGIARRALDEAGEFVRTTSRPYPDAGVERAAEDPVVVHAFGQLELAVRGSEALLRVAAEAVDAANRTLTEDTAAEASLAVAAARASSTAVSVDVASQLFQVAGTRAALAGLNLDRHWRNARTHSLHDPAGWKVHHLGRWAADGIRPPRHGQI
ncbi:SfnB family sulfur acquisition oxidoreductase [Nocardioides ginsengisoli]|uniref:SfnB family sulfur acquisition oxidoreductase n=1 Tax=Nocardioides ginsengisoli TaxID=363868 RepID=UPI00337348D6